MNPGKPIQYDAIYNSKNKVNVGVKCDPSVKLELAHEAAKLGMTLSEYVELILTTRNSNNSLKLEQLKGKLAFYENDLIKSEFLKYQGNVLDVENINGEVIQIPINRIEDIFTALITTIKTD